MTTRIIGGTGIEFPDATQQDTRAVPNNGPAFSAYISGGNVALPSGVLTAIPYNTLEYGDGLGFNTLTGEFTPPVLGIYWIGASVQVVGTPTGNQLVITKNGGLYKIINHQEEPAYNRVISGAVMVLADELGDTFQIMFRGLGSGLSIQGTIETHSMFQAHLVRAL